MGYSVDLKNISIDQYKEVLKATELIPSWKVLEKDIDKNLNIIMKNNIKDLDELLIAFKDKDNIRKFSKQSGLPENYLAVLKRVVSGYRRKPNRIKDFPCISENTAHKLDAVGIKNTVKLYEEVLTTEKRDELSRRTGLGDNEIMILTRLTDLSRIRWVNHTFAYVMLEAGYDTAKKVANADYQQLYETINNLIRRGKYIMHI